MLDVSTRRPTSVGLPQMFKNSYDVPFRSVLCFSVVIFGRVDAKHTKPKENKQKDYRRIAEHQIPLQKLLKLLVYYMKIVLLLKSPLILRKQILSKILSLIKNFKVNLKIFHISQSIF